MSQAAMLLDTRLAQARRDRLSGFAEADEAQARGVSGGHGLDRCLSDEFSERPVRIDKILCVPASEV